MDRMEVQEIHFLGEQDGPVERDLKGKIIGSFQPAMEIQTAYLARVSYGNQLHQHVALCLRGNGKRSQAAIREIRNAFRQHFKPTESLDILFLTPQQEGEIALIAKPFYSITEGITPST